MEFLSVFGGGLFTIPILTLVGAVIFARQAYIAHNSNSTTQHQTGGKNPNLPGGGPWTEDNTGNVPYTQIGQFWFAVVLVVATIVIVALMVSDK